MEGEETKNATANVEYLDVTDLVISVPSIAHVSEEEGTKSSNSSSEEFDPTTSAVFQKWNNPSSSPPKLNFFKFIAATQGWRTKARERRTKINVKSYVMYENTYKMGPEERHSFAVGKVEALLKETMEKRLQHVRYTAEGCRITTRELCADIKRKVKEFDFPRYKIVSEVMIVENKKQGIQISSRPLWNTDTDNFASYTFRNRTIIAVGNVYGVYYE